MLDNLEVKRLENLLFKYRKKLIIKRISFILLVLCVIVAGVVVALILPNDNSANEAKIASTNELRQKVQDLKQKAIDEKRANKNASNATMQDNNQALNEDYQNEYNQSLEQSNKTSKQEISKEYTDNTKIENENSKRITQKRLESKQTKNIEVVSLEEEPQIDISKDEENKKPQVVIESTSLDTSLNALQENFNKTHDEKYAKLLAKEYYNKKDYKNSAKWALTFNDINKDDPDGWIIFAKSKAKLGQKKDALRVLEAYENKSPDNKEIQALISAIRSNTLP